MFNFQSKLSFGNNARVGTVLDMNTTPGRGGLSNKLQLP